jgi:outer membrane receptor protein involved in Fe transport
MAVGGPCSGVNFFTANSLVQNTDKVKTEGLFGSVSFNFTDAFSASIEARYQKDDVKKGFLVAGATPARIKDESWLPRAIVRWQPTDATNVYAQLRQGHPAGRDQLRGVAGDAARAGAVPGAVRRHRRHHQG